MTLSTDPRNGADEIVLITGVVHAAGPSGAKLEGGWVLQFSLEAWRDATGALQHSELEVRREVSEDELDSFMDNIDAYRVVSLRVRLDEADSSADLVELVSTDASDAELRELARELQRPVVLQDEVFGPLVLDKRVDWYSGKVSWASLSIRLNVTPDDEGSAEASLAVAKDLWRDQTGWGKRISDFAVQKLLPLKNDTWLEDDEEALTPDQFRARMTLESITVDPDGSFTFWHNDGDLFFGHAIQICGSLSEGPTDADIPG